MKRLSTPPQLASWIEHWLSTQSNIKGTSPRIEPLPGDGSQRSFYRVSLPGETKILLHDPDWSYSKDYAVLQEFLKKRVLPVPDFLAEDPAAGCLLMEDLGDQLLQRELLADGAQKLPWLKKAVELLADLHGSTFPVPEECPVAGRCFDRTKYEEELLFTVEHLRRGLLKEANPKPAELMSLKEFCLKLEAIGPPVFCHRDYHSRNLIVHQNRLFLIDFQDARLGPPHYDLASLLFDAYVPITDEQRTEVLNAYRNRLGNHPVGALVDWTHFEASLVALGVQRTLKAAGSFASFYTKFGSNRHLPYLIPCLETAEGLMHKCPMIPKPFSSLFDLKHWIQKLETLPEMKETSAHSNN